MRMAGHTVHLSVDPARHAELTTATIELTAGGASLTLKITIPAGPTTMVELLPVLQGLASLFAARGTTRVEAAGQTISCRAGCGACCRQLVPVAGSEARHLATVVDALPAERRLAVRARFDAALAALDAAGLLSELSDPSTIRSADQGMRYFRLAIPCPFLEDEACSIHADRPLGCREYLVTSPAENCAALQDRQIDMVPIDWKLSRSLVRADPEEGWMPLVLALRFAKLAPPPRRQGGPDLLRAVITAGGASG